MSDESSLPRSDVWRISCGTCRRIREIMRDAPWSAYDLLASQIVLSIGVYLWLRPDLFGKFGGVYASMAKVGSERAWGAAFLLLGGLGLATVLWCKQPRFMWRLLARMGVAFCLLSFALNNLSNFPPPLSAVTYSLLSVWAMWGILRTKASGR